MAASSISPQTATPPQASATSVTLTRRGIGEWHNPIKKACVLMLTSVDQIARFNPPHATRQLLFDVPVDSCHHLLPVLCCGLRQLGSMLLHRGLVEVVLQDLQRLRPRNDTCLLHALTISYPKGILGSTGNEKAVPHRTERRFSAAALLRRPGRKVVSRLHPRCIRQHPKYSTQLKRRTAVCQLSGSVSPAPDSRTHSSPASASRGPSAATRYSSAPCK